MKYFTGQFAQLAPIISEASSQQKGYQAVEKLLAISAEFRKHAYGVDTEFVEKRNLIWAIVDDANPSIEIDQITLEDLV